MSYEIGSHEVFEGITYEVVALGRRVRDEHGAWSEWSFDEGKPLIEAHESALVLYPDDLPDLAVVLQSVDWLRQHARIQSAELEIDSRVRAVREVLLPYEDKGEDVPVPVVSALIRAAYGKGYCDCDADEGEMIGRLGYDHREPSDAV